MGYVLKILVGLLPQFRMTLKTYTALIVRNGGGGIRAYTSEVFADKK